MSTPIIVDVETTGFSPGVGDVVQICAIALTPEGDRQFTSYCNPGTHKLHTESAQSSLDFNGIPIGRIVKAPRIDDVASYFEAWLQELRDDYGGEPTFYAYNYKFDMRFLVADPWCIPEHWWSTDDLMDMAKVMMCHSEIGYAYPNKPPKLTEAEFALDIKMPGNPHDAVHDTMVEAEIYRRYQKFKKES